MPDDRRDGAPHPPPLDFWVDVELRPYQGGTWIATADLGGDRDVGMDTDPQRAVERALASLGWRFAREMAQGEWKPEMG